MKNAKSKSSRTISNKHANGKLTPREVRALIITIFTFVLIVAAVIFIPEIVGRMRNHIVDVGEDGLVVGMEDNWLVTNLGDGEVKKYSHLANVDPVEGYVLQGTGYLSDANERTLYFVSEHAKIPEYTVTVARGTYEEMPAAVLAGQEAVLTEILASSTICTEQADDVKLAYFWVNGTIDSMYDSEGVEITPEYDADGNAQYPQKYMLAVYCYVESSIQDRSVLLSVTMYNEAENAFVEPDEIIELLKEAAQQIQYL